MLVRTWNVGRHFLMGHGVLMLCLGMVLSSLGSLMTNPVFGQVGYTVAVGLTAVCLLIAGLVAYRGELKHGEFPRRRIAVFALAGALSIACWLIFFKFQSGTVDIRFLVLLAGFHGLFWGLWYMRLAFHFQAYSRKAVVLCVLAGTTTTLGIILATQFHLSEISAVTAVACYAMFIGIQILLTTLYVYRDCEV